MQHGPATIVSVVHPLSCVFVVRPLSSSFSPLFNVPVDLASRKSVSPFPWSCGAGKAEPERFRFTS